MIDGRRTRLVLVAISCGLAASALYWPTLAAQFVWDDHVLIERNPELEDWSGLWRGFTDVSGSLRGASYYRPILMASYFVDRQAWGLDAAGFHLTNVVLHGVVTGLVCALGYAYFGSLAAAAIGALLFALHPIQAQSVSLILGRNDLLLALPIVAMLLLAHHRRPIGSLLLLYAAALWTKETAIVAPVLLFAADAMLVGKRATGQLRRGTLAFGFVAVTAVYLVTRFEALGALASPSHGLHPWGERFPQSIAFLGYYIGHILLPWNLSPAPYAPRLANGWMMLESVGFCLLLAGAIAWALRRHSPVGYGLLFFLVGIVPVSGLVPIQVPVLEHRLYLPMVGVALAAAAVISRFDERWSLVITFPLLAVLAFATSARLATFHDDFALWSRAIERVPDSAYARHGYALALARIGRDSEAIEVFHEVLRLDPKFDKARYELALALGRTGQREQAIATIHDLLDRDPNDVDGWNALAFLWKQSGDLAKCKDALEQGLRIDPQNAVLLENLGDVLSQEGDHARALSTFEELVRLHPQTAAYRRKLDRLREPH